MIMRSLVLLVLAVALAAVGADALCSDHKTATECYANRATCHFDLLNVCQEGAALTCEEHLGDTFACDADNRCLLNTLNSLCYTKLPECPTLNSLQCSQRSDCTFDTTCQTGPAPGTCGTHVTGAACQAAGCYSELYLDTSPKCFSNLQEVNRLYSCEFWSNYPNSFSSSRANYACTSHGCASTYNLCFPVDAGTNNDDILGGKAYSTLDYSILPPVVTSDLDFSAQVLLDLYDFVDKNEPKQYTIVIGTDNDYDSLLTTPGRCTTSGYNMPLDVPLVRSNYGDVYPGLLNHVISTVTNTHNLSFLANDERDQAVNNIIGLWRFDPVESIGQRVNIVNGNTNIALTVGNNLLWLMAHCGVKRTETANYYQFVVPIQVASKSLSSAGTGNNVAVSHTNFTVDVYNHGLVQIQTTSRYVFSLELENIVSTPDGCPFNHRRRTFTAVMQFGNAFDSSKIVGVPSLANIHIPKGSHCFGMVATSIEVPTACPDFSCTTKVSFSSQCRISPPDCNGLNFCQYASVEDRAAIVDAWNVGQPLDSLYTFPTSASNFQYGFSYDVAVWDKMIGVTDPGIYIDPQVQRPLDIQLSEPVCPVRVSTNVTLTVVGGFLPTPTSSLLSVLGSINSVAELPPVAGAPQVGNTQLYDNRVLSPVLYFPGALDRELYTLSLVLDQMIIRPLSPYGLPIVSEPAFLTWNDIAPVVYNSPREQVCPTCVLLPSVAAEIGSDGFSIPVVLLRAKMPANGYAIEMRWKATLPNVEPVTGRRLLQAGGGGQQTVVMEGSNTLTIVLANGTTIDASNHWDLGPTSTSTDMTIGVVALLVGAPVAGVAGLGFALSGLFKLSVFAL